MACLSCSHKALCRQEDSPDLEKFQPPDSSLKLLVSLVLGGRGAHRAMLSPGLKENQPGHLQPTGLASAEATGPWYCQLGIRLVSPSPAGVPQLPSLCIDTCAVLQTLKEVLKSDLKFTSECWLQIPHLHLRDRNG